jgi:multicomponent Na+:H+ antiporter subunit B
VSSLILRTATVGLVPALLLYSVYLLVAGHDHPGGGFVGGLVAAAAFALHALAFGIGHARQAVRLHPQTLVALGLLLALASGVAGLIAGGAFMEGLWTDLRVPDLGTLTVGTPVLFDAGVYLLVIGVTLLILFPIAE